MDDVAARVLDALEETGGSLATAESLTGGQVAVRITSVPGASAVFRGSVVAYATEVKRDVLGVPASVIDTVGVISAECARAMARGARRVLGADYAVATTGVAGPASQEGRPAGTVFVAVAGPEGEHAVQLELSGTRPEVQAQTVERVLDLLDGILRGEEPAVG